MSPAEIAEGFLRIAVENMANAIKKISVQRGHDVRPAGVYAPACFGGAGGQHACAVANALSMTTVVVHPFAGVLSAYGMGLAELRVLRELAVDAPLEGAGDLEVKLSALDRETRNALLAQGVADGQIAVSRSAFVKYVRAPTWHAVGAVRDGRDDGGGFWHRASWRGSGWCGARQAAGAGKCRGGGRWHRPSETSDRASGSRHGGIHLSTSAAAGKWIPAFAGMTVGK